jgi:competence protein ComEC
VKLTERWNLKEIISTTIATQITVLPFLIYNMGLLSLVALPVNVLILGTIPLTMLFGFITGFVGLFSLYLSFIPAFFTYILLWYQLTIIHLGASVPFGAVSLPAFSPFVLILIYGVIFAVLFIVRKKN